MNPELPAVALYVVSLLGKFVAFFALNCLLFSFVEWWVHRTLMHRRPLPKSWYRLSYLAATFENHAVLHHQKFYEIYDYEPDPVGRELNIRFQWSDLLTSNLLLLPLHAAYWSVSPVGSVALVSMLLCYMFSWNALHAEMHMPTNGWAFRNPGFRFLNRHHYMHHMHPGRNYNVVFPLPDYLFGSVVHPSEREMKAMHDLGLYGDARGINLRRGPPAPAG